MTLLANGEPEIHKLKSGIEHGENEVRNLGELFKEALKNNKRAKAKKRVPIKRSITGIHHVSKHRGEMYTQKFFFKFTYKKDGKVRTTQRKTLVDLYHRVKELGYDFEVIDRRQAIGFLNNNCNKEDYQFLCDKLNLIKKI